MRLGLRLVVWSVVLGKRAGRGALKLLKRPLRFERRLVHERGMRPDRVAIEIVVAWVWSI